MGAVNEKNKKVDDSFWEMFSETFIYRNTFKISLEVPSQNELLIEQKFYKKVS